MTLLSALGYNRSQQQQQQQQNTGDKNTSTGNHTNDIPQKYYSSDGNNSQLRHFQAHPSPSLVPSSSSSLMMPRRLPGFSNNPSSTVIATVQPIQPLSASMSISMNSKNNRLDKNTYNRVATISTPVVVTVKRNPSPASHRLVKKKIYL